MRIWASTSLVLFLLAGLVTPRPANAQDENEDTDYVVLSNGHRLGGIKVLEDTYKGVRYQQDPRLPAQDLSYGNVADVVYVGRPSDWKRMVRLIRDGHSSEEAFKYFKKQFGKSQQYPWMQQYALYYMARALLERGQPGDPEAAIKILDRLLETDPDTRYLYDAHLDIAEAYFQMQKYDEAIQKLEKTSREFTKLSREHTGDLSDFIRQMALKAELEKVKVYEKGKRDYARAKSQYRGLAGRASRFPEIEALAEAGMIRCLIMGEEYDEVIRRAQDVIERAERTGDESALVSAYLGLGDAYLAKADQLAKRQNMPGAIENWMRARYNFLKVIVRYAVEDSDLAYARLNAGICCLKLREEEKGAQRQARRQFRLLKENHPETPYGKKAASILAQLGTAEE